MIYIGIDPGLDGGIAFIDDGKHSIQGASIKVFKTPVISGKEYDIGEMRKILEKNTISRTCLALIENQISMPGQGLTSTLQTGKGFGVWLGLLAGLGLPYQVIGAKQWQTKLFTGVKGTLDTKAKSEVIAKRLFPDVDFRKSERATKANDGLTDAILIAEYGRRISGNDVPVVVIGNPHTANPKNPHICINCGTFIPTAEENNCPQQSLYDQKTQE